MLFMRTCLAHLRNLVRDVATVRLRSLLTSYAYIYWSEQEKSGCFASQLKLSAMQFVRDAYFGFVTIFVGAAEYWRRISWLTWVKPAEWTGVLKTAN